jgi:hypothetical protein
MIYEGLTDEPVPTRRTPLPTTYSTFPIRRTNLFYCGKFLFFTILCYIFFYSGYTWLGKIINSAYEGQIPSGISLVARTTSSLAIWFFVHAVLTFSNRNLEDSCQLTIHTSLLWLHSLLYIPLWVGFWFIPDSFFDIYIAIGYWISGLYLVVQVLALISLFHDFNDRLAETSRVCYMVTITVVLSVLSVAGFAVCYWQFSDSGASIAIVSVNIVACIALWVLSLRIEHGSIFTASFVALYVAFLTFNGLIADTALTETSTPQAVIFSVVAAVFTLLWLVYIATTSNFGFQAFFPCCAGENGEGNCPCCCCLEENDPARQTCACLCSRPTPFSLSSFHGILAMATVYVTMLVTHWGNGANPTAVDGGKVARWVNLAASWLVCLVYLWTLLATILCTERDFNVEP